MDDTWYIADGLIAVDVIYVCLVCLLEQKVVPDLRLGFHVL